jgi:hypothetical protein
MGWWTSSSLLLSDTFQSRIANAVKQDKSFARSPTGCATTFGCLATRSRRWGRRFLADFLGAHPAAAATRIATALTCRTHGVSTLDHVSSVSRRHRHHVSRWHHHRRFTDLLSAHSTTAATRIPTSLARGTHLASTGNHSPMLCHGRKLSHGHSKQQQRK